MNKELLNQRLATIELLLIWEGEISNARLRELFGIHRTQVSNLIMTFRTRFPLACIPDTKLRRFIPNTALFQASLTDGTLRSYVAAIAQGVSPSPNIELVKTINIDTPSEIFSRIAQSIRHAHGVEITYRSFTQTDNHDRVIFPHTLVQTQGRWHVRAFCKKTDAYKDFVVGRISRVEPINDTYEKVKESDIAWNTFIELRMGAHPMLNPQAQEIISVERFKGANGFAQEVRAALAQYVLHELRVATNVETQLPPDYILALSNKKSVAKWLFKTEASN